MLFTKENYPFLRYVFKFELGEKIHFSYRLQLEISLKNGFLIYVKIRYVVSSLKQV